MNIGSGNGYPESALSNFAPHSFVFRGVQCASMEGLLQSLKFDKAHIQVEVCKLVGLAAKYRGKKRNKAWKSKQVLWWDGKEMPRASKAYQMFLDSAFASLATNENFKKALLASGDSILTHTLGSNKESETVLTEAELCSRLTKLRRFIKLTTKAKEA